MEKSTQPNWDICSISTKDKNFRDNVRKLVKEGVTYEDILRRGFEEIAQERLTQNNNA